MARSLLIQRSWNFFGRNHDRSDGNKKKWANSSIERNLASSADSNGGALCGEYPICQSAGTQPIIHCDTDRTLLRQYFEFTTPQRLGTRRQILHKIHLATCHYSIGIFFYFSGNRQTRHARPYCRQRHAYRHFAHRIFHRHQAIENGPRDGIDVQHWSCNMRGFGCSCCGIGSSNVSRQDRGSCLYRRLVWNNLHVPLPVCIRLYATQSF